MQAGAGILPTETKGTDLKVKERILDVDSTLTGERVGMTIDTSALSHIMSVLTDLYSDPEMAIIREYSTNALDAHVEAGEKRPIEVTLPSALSPFFRVKDYGVGMSADDIRDIYSRYGTSTKRDSNDVVGMLGLGCKSALTYTDQFTLTGIKDEVLTTVSVSRDADGGGSMTIVNQESTTEESGVEVIIPVKRDNEIAEKANDFFQYWKPGTVLVNKVEPKPIEGIKITDDLLVIRARPHNYFTGTSDTIVMGNVPYPAKIKPGHLSHNSRVVAWVPIGTVSFTPSREQLQDTRSNTEAITALAREIEAKMTAAFQARIEEAPNHHEAAKAMLECRSLGMKSGATYKGQPFPSEFKGVDDRYMLIPGVKQHRRKDGVRQRRVSIDNVVNCTWIENFDNVGFTPTMREKLNTYRAESRPDGEQVNYFILVDKITPEERMWLRDDQVWDWTPIGEIKINRKQPDGTSKPRGSYKGRSIGPNGENTWYEPILAEKIDTTKPLIWSHGNTWEVQGDFVFRQFPDVVPNDATIICLEANRMEKFKRDFPMAKRLSDLWTEYVEKFYKTLTKDDLLHLQMGATDKRLLQALAPDKVDDPDLRRWITLANHKIAAGTVKRYNSLRRYSEPPKAKEANPLKKYPLVEYGYHSSAQLAHIYIYLNAAYAAERKAT